jgi:hypothetical protein
MALVGTVVITIVAVIGYYAYRQYSVVSLPPSSAGNIGNTEAKIYSAPVRPAPRPDACPERVAALGLCPPDPAPKNEAEAAAAVPAAVVPPAQTKSGAEPCTEPRAALGLCTPKSK